MTCRRSCNGSPVISGIHHVHHLSSKVPFYRLPEVLRDFPALQETNRIGFRESLGCVKLVLWDEEARRLISFREARRAAVAREAAVASAATG